MTNGSKLIGGNETILIVDDDVSLQQMTAQFLERIGYKVVLASDATSAIQKMLDSNSHFHVMILDINLPGMSGIEAYKEFKKISPDLKIIISSGYDFDDELKTALDLNNDTILPKPYRITSLANLLRQLLDHSE